MTRVTEANYTVPMTVALGPDERGLLDAYAAANRITVAEVLRRCATSWLGEADNEGNVRRGGSRRLVVPEAALVRNYVREQRERGQRLADVKRARQRQSTSGE